MAGQTDDGRRKRVWERELVYDIIIKNSSEIVGKSSSYFTEIKWIVEAASAAAVAVLRYGAAI